LKTGDFHDSSGIILISYLSLLDIFGTGVLIEISSTLEKPVHLVLNMIPPRVRESEVLKFVRTLSSHFTVDMSGWVPFSEEVIGSLSRTVLMLKGSKNGITSRFRQIAESVESFA